MLKNTSPNWNFYLISTLLRGKFFVSPDYALAAGSQVANILNRDWDGMPTQDLENDRSRAELPYYAVSHDKEAFASFNDAPEGSTAIIPLKGSMLKYGTWCTYGTEEIAAKINAAALHPNISSIVLDIDSGGGSVDSVAPIVQAIQFARNADKPVVASVDMACSAAYWAASACNSIIADNNISSTIGSIGVMMSFWDVKGYYEAQGYKLHVVYAPESDHKNLAWEKALEGEYDLIKSEELSPLAISFQNAIKENRSGKLDLTAKGLLNGKTYLAEQAVKVGLIDEIGNRETAMERAQQLVEVNKFLKS